MGGLILSVVWGVFIAAVVAPEVFAIALPVALLSSRGQTGIAVVRRHKRVQLAALAAVVAGGLSVVLTAIVVGAR
jgi:hypothetical protein